MATTKVQVTPTANNNIDIDAAINAVKAKYSAKIAKYASDPAKLAKQEATVAKQISKIYEKVAKWEAKVEAGKSATLNIGDGNKYYYKKDVGVVAVTVEGAATTAAAQAARPAAAEAERIVDEVVTPVPTTPTTVTTPGTSQSQTFTLTTAQDNFVGGTGADILRGVAGQNVGNQDQSTFNSSDILDGAAGEDKLVINMTGNNYAGGATVKNIETLQIGTNITAGATTFDYNVNNGAYEITGVNTVVYDQINTGETLNVVNLTPTSTTNGLPTLLWDNEAGSIAGTAGVTFREAGVAGATQLNVALDDVRNGQFNIGNATSTGKIETVKITSQGTTTNTLIASANQDGQTNTADIVSASEGDTVNNGALTKVIVDGAQKFGKVAELVTDTTNANYGLMNRVAAGATDAGRDATTTASNLISVAATVTEIDASAATGDVSMRFTPRENGAEVSQTFKGGSGNDYIEFQQGNVNATGGDGNDTFAFVNGLVNSTLTTADSLVGGAGTDTLQLGINGAGTYNLETTEFNNKTGIDVLDLRGQTNTIKLSDGFVTAADAGLTVRTDKVVQTASGTGNDTVTTTNNQLENQMVNTIDLTALAANRSLDVIGGSGSDRLLVNEVALNGNIKFDGGTNAADNAAGTVAGAGDYDTLTVLNNAVLTRGDLANIKGIEGIVLAENTTGNSVFSVELTEAFILANTAATNSAGTDINDTILQIITAAAANGNALTAADTVNIDVTDLFNTATGALKATLVNRAIDVNGIGATVNFIYNGQTLTLAGLQALVDANGDAFVAGNDGARASVSGSAAAVAAGAAAAAGVVLTADIVGGTYTGTANADTANVSANNTVSLGGGNDILNVTAAITGASTIDLGAGTNIVNVNVANGLVTATDIASTGSTTNTLNVNADVTGAAFNIGTNMDIFQTIAFRVDQVSGGNLITINNNATTITAVGGDFLLGTGGDNFNASGSSATQVNIVTGGAGADTIVGGAAADTIANLATGSANTAGDVLTGNGGADTFILRGDVASSSINVAYAAAPRITDFTLGTDILSLSSTNTNYTGAGTGFAAGITAATAVAAGVTAIQDVAQSAGAAVYVAGTDLIKLTTGVATTTNMTVQQIFDAAIGTSTVTGLGAGTEIFVAVYDTTNARMLVGLVDAVANTNTTVETGDAVTLVGTIDMTAANYAAFSNASLSFVAA